MPNVIQPFLQEIIQNYMIEKNISALQATNELVSEALAKLVAEGKIEYDIETELFTAK